MKRLLLASGNPAKLVWLRRLLEGVAIELVTPAETGWPAPPTEEGADAVDVNAERKAQAWSATYGVPSVASDGGLVVPALGQRWRPALTRRAAGEGVSAEAHARHLIGLMRGLHEDERRAFQIEAVALADGDGQTRGVWQARGPDGLVASSYDGRGVPAGFWLPGVLLFGPDRRRYGDLTPEERAAADDHWLQLRQPLRTAVETMVASRAAG